MIPCIWCDSDARAAAALYVGAFPDSRITSETPFMVGFELNGRPLLAMNGGPKYRPNPRLFLFGFFDSEEEVNHAHGLLMEGGSELMPLGAYPWSPRYAGIFPDSGGSHTFEFTEGMSLLVFADTQDELDRYWDALIADGGEESRPGWLRGSFR